MNIQITSPVLFLVFNRPEKTQRVFDVIRSAKPQKLYIAADAPRKNNISDRENCLKVRGIVLKIDWPCDVKYLFHEENLGCSLAGKKAWDWLFSQEDEMIFIEDDGLVSKSFFWYCQELLKKYKYDEKIAYIGGVNYGLCYGNATYFFSKVPAATYSMATWKRVNDLYEFKLESYISGGDKNLTKQNFINCFAYAFYKKQFKNFISNGGNTYDLQMQYLVYKYNMLSIYPNLNLSSNIGLDLGGANNNIDPNSKIALKLGNRPRFEIKEINHPEGVNIDIKFEKNHFKLRVLYGHSWAFAYIKLYAIPLIRPFYQKLIKPLIKIIKK